MALPLGYPPGCGALVGGGQQSPGSAGEDRLAFSRDADFPLRAGAGVWQRISVLACFLALVRRRTGLGGGGNFIFRRGVGYG